MTLDDHIREVVQMAVKEALESTGRRVEPRLLTLTQAADYLGRTPGATRQLMRSGRIPSVRLDGRVMFDRQDLDRVIDQAKEAA